MKALTLAALLCALLTSCSSIGGDGRRWLQIPLPPDPLREFLIKSINNKKKAGIKVPVNTPSAELLPPPAGYMFSARRTSTGYEIRGMTGSVEKMTHGDYLEFFEVATRKGWKVYRF